MKKLLLLVLLLATSAFSSVNVIGTLRTSQGAAIGNGHVKFVLVNCAAYSVSINANNVGVLNSPIEATDIYLACPVAYYQATATNAFNTVMWRRYYQVPTSPSWNLEAAPQVNPLTISNGGNVGGVGSFAGRIGLVTPQSGDYSFSLISGLATKSQLPATTVHTDQANTFGAFLQKFKTGANLQLTDSSDATKILQFDLSNIGTGQTRTVNIPNANSTTVQSSTAGSNQFAIGVSAQGVLNYAQPSFSNLSGTATSGQVPLAGTASALAANGTNCGGGQLAAGVDASGNAEGCASASTPGQFVVDGTTYANIQAAITAASTTGSVLIPANYAGSDVYTNSNKIQIIDLRGKPNRQRGFINMLTDCGLKGDGVTDDSTAANACFAAFPGYEFFFPKTQANGTCNYLFNSMLTPTGAGWVIRGGASMSYTSLSFGDHLGGTELCFAPGVKGILMDNSGAGTVRDISLNGQSGTQGQATASRLNLPPVSTLYSRSISAIQRTTNVLTVTVSATGSEGLSAQVGSILSIAGVVGDATMNGTCVVASLSNTATNPLTFTCAQNGADSGPFGAVGTVSPYTTGTSTADGIQVCGNFNSIIHTSIANFGRYGINAAENESGCVAPFADDLIVRDSVIAGNQGSGIFLRGNDANAGHIEANAIYYNGVWGGYDASFLGNSWIGNQASYNGLGGASGATPATQNISAISRALSGSNSTVSVTTATANTNIKVGSAVVIAGVTDSSFNTTANSAFFVTQVTDSTHYQYIQPGAPGNASSSGGTSRMAKFSEALLGAGLDNGAFKIGASSAVFNQAMFSNYVEGGQNCKFGASVINIGGEASQCGAGTDFAGMWIAAGVTGIPGSLASNIRTFTDNKDNVFGYQLFFRAGVSGGTTRPFGFNFYDNNTNTASWSQQVNPSGTTGGSWEIARGNAGGGGVRRLIFFGATNGAITRINSEVAGGVEVNKDANSGTGGLVVCSGGASPTCPASPVIDSANTHFAAVLKSATANPASAGYERLAKTDVINFRNNAASGDVNGLSLDGSDVVQVGGSLGVKLAGPLVPTVAAGSDIGSAPLPWKDLYLAGTSGTPGTNNFKITGASTSGTRVVTLADGASTTVIADTGSANNFLTAISAAGVISKAQPSFTNLSGSVASGQMPALTGDTTTSAGSTVTTTSKLNGVAYSASPSTDTTPVITAANTATYSALPSCSNAVTSKLLYNTSTHAFSCGTDQGGGGGMTNPMTTLGDIIYEDATPTPARLAGNTSATKMFLSQTGNGSISAVPAWGQPAFTDITGTATKAQLPATAVYTDQANTYSTGVVQTFADGTNTTFVNATTASKKAILDLSNISTVTTRTINVPDANSTTAQAKSSVGSQWLNAMSAQGVFTSSQPAFTDISGTATNAQLPSTISSKTLDNSNTYTVKDGSFTLQNSADTTKQVVVDASNVATSTTRMVNIPNANSTTAQAKSSVGSQWLNSMSAQGVFTSSQPAFTDISGTSTKAQSPAADVYTDQANTFGAFVQTFQGGANHLITDTTDLTKKFQFDVSNVATSTTRTVNIPNANSTTIQADTGAANNFITAVSAQGVISKAQPALTNLSSGTSADLRGVLSDEVGTGVAMFSPKQDIMDAAAFCSDAGANDTYTCNLSPAITAYVTGTNYRFKANTANTGAATINFNSLGAITIKKMSGAITTDLADNDIRVGQWVDMVYDGTNMQMQGQLGNAGSGSSAWSALTNPSGNLALTMAANTSTFTYNATTGAGVNMFALTDTTSNTGTGALLDVASAQASNAIPLQLRNISTGITANVPLLKMTPIWNNSGITFTAMLFNLTDSASNAASLLLDMQVGGSSKFKVDKAGNITASTITAGASGGVGGTIDMPEGTAATAASAHDILYADSTAHRVKISVNNGSFDNLVAAASTDTLTNKTIDTAGTNTLKVNGNTLSASAGTATLTLPNSTDTLLGRTTTDTVTNKTLTGPVITSSVVASLPSAGSSTGQIYVVTDSTSATACTTGGGSNKVLCRSDGSAWAPLGDGSAAGGTGLTDPGSNGIVARTGAGPTTAARTFQPTAGGAFTWTNGDGVSGNPTPLLILPVHVSMPVAGCNNATAGPAFDLPTTNAPTPTCYGTNVRFGGLDFADSAVQKAYTHVRLPDDWGSGDTVDVKIKWFTTATTNATKWQVKTGCPTDGTTDMTVGPTLNTANTTTTNDGATASSSTETSIATLTVTGCTAGRDIFLELSRDNTDTNTATSTVYDFVFIPRRRP
jgi:hypothetical protein